MSKNKKTTSPEVDSQKVMTKYDKKMQRRKEEAAKAKKENFTANLILILGVLLFAGFVAYFPINNYLSVNGAYVTIGDEKINKVEFDYNYGLAKASYVNSNAYMLSMFGMDVSTIEAQNYNDDLTFAQYFEQLTVENLTTTLALKKQAEAEGFTYDVTADYEEMLASMESIATEAGITVEQYLKDNYGSLATIERLEESMKQGIYAAAFYDAKMAELAPTVDQINAHYNENKDSYDSVDYHMTAVDAELPTTNPDGSKPVDEEGNEIAYVPTEEEKAAAMADAKKEADALLADIATDGEEFTNATKSGLTTALADFLFGAETQVGDTAVVEDTLTSRYYVVSLDARYLNEEPTTDARIIITSKVSGDDLMAEWEAAGATEDAFVELGKKYDENGMGDYGCLFEGVDPSGLDDEMAEWFLGERTAGDTTVITDEEGYAYALYYIGENKPSWYLSVQSTLSQKAIGEYVDALIENVTVKDNRANLAYLKVKNSEEE